METILEHPHPQAQELLEAATITADQVSACAGLLDDFLARYLPLFTRSEQREHAKVILKGKLSSLERKTSEPIAIEADLPRKPLQSFVGAGAWDDESIMAQLRDHIRLEWNDPDSVLVIDPSSFPKKGTHSCGVQRQWCGRLGKVENCQVGVFLFYASKHGHAGLDRRLFLPKEWADDKARRDETHVPQEVVYLERWQIALGMIRGCKELPHARAEEVELKEAVRAGSERHRAEQVLQEAKGEVGLGQYEVRSWVGWHHHMTLSLLALWFLALYRGRVGGEKDRVDCLDAASGLQQVAGQPAPQRGTDCRTHHPRAAA
jgi:SRSO17 transposase